MTRLIANKVLLGTALFALAGLPGIGTTAVSAMPMNKHASSHTRPEMSLGHFQVTIHNVSTDQPLAPGIYVVHDDRASLNFEGQLSPAAFESLAEVGSPTAAAELVATLPGVHDVIVMDAPVTPGESTTLNIQAPVGSLLSGLQMPVATNDGLALVDSVKLTGRSQTIDAANYDNGTEENSPLGSGFDGGQPDPSRGAENIDNGVATDPQEPFAVHPQLTDTVLRVSVDKMKKDKAPKSHSYDVTIYNTSTDQPLAPGIYVVHDDRASLNFEGQLSPAAFESLAEVGSPAAAAELVQSLPGVMSVHVMDAPILPGEMTQFEIMAPHGYLFSGLQMPVATNDGLALIDSITLQGEAVEMYAENYDNGTEENSPLGSGFDGGQPDPSRGAENIDNGVATDPQEVVAPHPQLTTPVLKASVEPVRGPLSCELHGYNRNNMSETFSSGQDIALHTNVGLKVHAPDAVSYDWYVDFNGDDIENTRQHEVAEDTWSYTVWSHGTFTYTVKVTDVHGETATCSFDVHVPYAHDRQ